MVGIEGFLTMDVVQLKMHKRYCVMKYMIMTHQVTPYVMERENYKLYRTQPSGNIYCEGNYKMNVDLDIFYNEHIHQRNMEGKKNNMFNYNKFTDPYIGLLWC